MFLHNHDGITWTVTERGLSQIAIGQNVVYAGIIEFSFADWFLDGSGALDWSAAQKTLETLSPTACRVTHSMPACTVVYDYVFDGEDLTLTAAVTNGTMQMHRGCWLKGMQFIFAGTYSGLWGASNNISGLIQRGRGTHPSFDTPVGGQWMADSTHGIGLSPNELTFERTLFTQPYGSPVSRAVGYVVLREFHPGSTQRFSFRLRVSGNLDWKHLLQPYKDYFEGLHGTLKYAKDERPVGQFVASSGGWVTGGNARGYTPGMRLDQSAGVSAFIAHAIPNMQICNAQSAILWGYCGSHSPGGYDYSPNFDVLPADTQAVRQQLVSGFAEFALGTHSRPGQQVFLDEYPNGTTQQHEQVVNAKFHMDDRYDTGVASFQSVTLSRFSTMAASGFPDSYVDSFGSEYDHARFLNVLRQQYPDSLIFSEFWSDVSMLDAGGYMQLSWNSAKHTYVASWGYDVLWPYVQWLTDGQAVSKFTSRDASLSPYQWMHDRGITPLFPLGSSQTAPDVAEIASIYN